MAYKFQIGAAKLAGATTFDDAMTVSSNVTLNADLALSAGVIDNAELANDSVTVAGKTVALGSSILLDTDDVSEGSNLYYTNARAQAAISVTGDLSYNAGVVHFSMSAHDTGDLAEGSNLYYTDARVRGAVSAGAGLAFNSESGQFSLSSSVAGDGLTLTNGVLDVDLSEITANIESSIDAHLEGGVGIGYSAGVISFTGSTDDVSEGVSNLYYTDARARAAISVTDVSGDGSLTYDSGSGVITYTGPSAAEVRAHFSGAAGIDLTDGAISVNVDGSSIEIVSDTLQVRDGGITNAMLSGSIASSKIAELNAFDTGDLAEGSNLYFTDARARAAISVTDNGGDGSLSYDSATGVISYTGPSASEVRAHLSVTDNGGDGSLSYDSATGVISYTGPSAAEARAHFSGGTGVDITNGVVSIGQAVETNSDVTFNHLTLGGNAVIAGNLEVQGTLTYINSTDLEIEDKMIVINKSGSLSGSGTVGFQLENSLGDDLFFQYSYAQDKFELVDASSNYKDLKVKGLEAESIAIVGGALDLSQAALKQSIQVVSSSAGAGGENAQAAMIFAHKDTQVNLPAAANYSGYMIMIKNDDLAASAAEPVVIAAATGETVENASSISLVSPGAAITCICDGSEWFVI